MQPLSARGGKERLHHLVINRGGLGTSLYSISLVYQYKTHVVRKGTSILVFIGPITNEIEPTHMWNIKRLYMSQLMSTSGIL